LAASLAPGRRDNQRAGAPQTLDVADPVAAGVDVGEPAPGAPAAVAGFGAADTSQAGHGLTVPCGTRRHTRERAPAQAGAPKFDLSLYVPEALPSKTVASTTAHFSRSHERTPPSCGVNVRENGKSCSLSGSSPVGRGGRCSGRWARLC